MSEDAHEQAQRIAALQLAYFEVGIPPRYTRDDTLAERLRRRHGYAEARKRVLG